MNKLIFMIFMVGMQSAHANFFTTGQLLSKLTSTEVSDIAIGHGYLAGVHDTGKNALHCNNNRITLLQLGEMSTLYIQSNPGTHNLPADVVLSNFYSRLWPCKQGNMNL